MFSCWGDVSLPYSKDDPTWTNDLIFVFYEKSTELKKNDPNNVTKKIYLRSSTNKKTIKKTLNAMVCSPAVVGNTSIQGSCFTDNVLLYLQKI